MVAGGATLLGASLLLARGMLRDVGVILRDAGVVHRACGVILRRIASDTAGGVSSGMLICHDRVILPRYASLLQRGNGWGCLEVIS